MAFQGCPGSQMMDLRKRQKQPMAGCNSAVSTAPMAHSTASYRTKAPIIRCGCRSGGRLHCIFLRQFPQRLHKRKSNCTYMSEAGRWVMSMEKIRAWSMRQNQHTNCGYNGFPVVEDCCIWLSRLCHRPQGKC